MCDKVLFLRLCEAQQGKVPARFLKKIVGPYNRPVDRYGGASSKKNKIQNPPK